MMADKWFNFGTYKTIQNRIAKPNAGDTYLLRFDFDSNVMNHMRYMFAGRKVYGTCHADDCNFIFKACITGNISEKSLEFQTIDRFVINLFHIFSSIINNQINILLGRILDGIRTQW